MEKKRIGEFEVVDISAEEMADYLTRAFSRRSTEELLTSATSLSDAESKYQNLGNILQAYASATGDLSDKTIDGLVADLAENADVLRQDYDNSRKLSPEQKYFGAFVMPKIAEVHRQRLGLSEPLSFEDSCRVLASVEAQSKNNKFKTHSFNGALLPEIKANGLDISKEKFQEEFAILRQAKMYQPYQTGNLLFCDMSKSTFGYTLRAPERLVMSLATASDRQKDNQSVGEFLTQNLQQKLQQNETVADAEKGKVYAAGKKIIDFYFGEAHQSAVAIVKDSGEHLASGEKYKQMLGRQFGAMFGMRLEGFCRQNQDEQSVRQYQEAVAEFNEKGDLKKLEQFTRDFAQKYPDSKLLNGVHETFMTKNMSEFGLNNFTYAGNSDGYRVPSGKLSPDKFAVAEFENPINVYVSHQKGQELCDNKLAMLRNRIARKADHLLGTDFIEKTKLPQPLKNAENMLWNALNRGRQSGKGA